jgi:hypothetical protein
VQKTRFDPAARAAIVVRLRSLDPARPPLWGKMTAPQMVAHLSDQMRHCLGDAPAAPSAVCCGCRWSSTFPSTGSDGQKGA